MTKASRKSVTGDCRRHVARQIHHNTGGSRNTDSKFTYPRARTDRPGESNAMATNMAEKYRVPIAETRRLRRMALSIGVPRWRWKRRPNKSVQAKPDCRPSLLKLRTSNCKEDFKMDFSGDSSRLMLLKAKIWDARQRPMMCR